MSDLLLIVAVLGTTVVLLTRPNVRRRAGERLARRLAPIAAKVLGPLSPRGFVHVTVRAAKARATETLTGAFLPNHIIAGVHPHEYDAWGPLGPRVVHDIVAALREAVAEDESLMLFGRPVVEVKRDPQARPRRPRYVMSVIRPQERDATRYRPADPSRNVTPLRPLARVDLDATVPLAEVQPIVDGVPRASVRLSEGRHDIGRHRSASVVIDDPSVSQRHAVAAVTRQFTTICDAGSTNGTFVGRSKADVPLLLADGDVVKLSGNVELRVLRAGAQHRAS